jgi:hypothetical protein
VLAVPRLVEAELPVQLILFDERQDGDAPAEQGLAVLVEDGRAGERGVGVVEAVQREADLLEVVLAGFAVSRGRFREGDARLDLVVGADGLWNRGQRGERESTQQQTQREGT